jgi:hypothetical protein
VMVVRAKDEGFRFAAWRRSWERGLVAAMLW